MGGPPAAGVPWSRDSVTNLRWTGWLSIENCFRAQGEQFTWFVRPSVIDGKWNLSRVANTDRIGYAQGVGIFDGLEEAKAAAQRTEIGS